MWTCHFFSLEYQWCLTTSMQFWSSHIFFSWHLSNAGDIASTSVFTSIYLSSQFTIAIAWQTYQSFTFLSNGIWKIIWPVIEPTLNVILRICFLGPFQSLGPRPLLDRISWKWLNWGSLYCYFLESILIMRGGGERPGTGQEKELRNNENLAGI